MTGTTYVTKVWLKKRVAGVVMVLALAALVLGAVAAYLGAFSKHVTVYVTSPRSGLVMDPGAKVMLHGVTVGAVAETTSDGTGARLVLQIPESNAVRIPADLVAEIRSTTAFGAKFVDLQPQGDTSTGHLGDGTIIESQNVTTEVNTVFQNLTTVLDSVDADKLNATLGAISQALRGRGDQLGHTIDNADEYLRGLNPSLPQLTHDLEQFARVADTYSDAAPDLIATARNATAIGNTIVDQRSNLDALLLGVTGLADTGNEVLGQNKDAVVTALDVLRPTADLLMKYNGTITCFIQGLDHAADAVNAGVRDGKQILDTAIIPGNEPYRYGQDLPVVGAKGGPGGVAGSCGALPYVEAAEYPVPYLVTDTGTGTNPPGPSTLVPGNPSVVQYLIGSYTSQFGGNGVPR